MTLAMLALVLLVENAARLSVPQLVQRGIDRGIPPIMGGGSAHELMLIVGTLCGVALVQAASRLFFPQPLRAGTADGVAEPAASGLPAPPAARHRLP
jgi:hypothetical protein